MQPNDTLFAIEQLQYEIRTLIDQQNQAIRDAVFTDRTTEQEKQFDTRRKRITLLQDKITRLQRSR